MKQSLCIVALCAALVGCSTDAKPVAGAKTNLTRHQQDSLLAQSKVPGAKPVGRALTTADSQSAKAAQFNAMQDTIH